MAGAFDLQPMSIGDILDRAVRLYRRDVVRILAIVALVEVPIVGSGWALGHAKVEGGIASAAIYVLSYFGGNFGLGALTLFVSERFLGRPADIWGAYRHVLRRTGSLLWVLVLYLAVWAGAPAVAIGVAIGLPAVIGLRGAPWWMMAVIGIAGLALIPGIVLSVLAFFRLSLVTEVLILEDIRGRAALRRSWRLMRPNTGRAIVILVFWVIVRAIVSLLTELPARTVAAATPGPAANAFVLFTATLADVLTVPFLAIAFILLYYDSRIRQEAFDLEMMARDLGSSRAAPAATAIALAAGARGPVPVPNPSPGSDATLVPAPAPAGASVPAASVPPRPAPPAAAPRGLLGSFKICPTCNARVPRVRPACPACGTSVPFERR